MNDLIVITGQTATGKTNLALDYAKRINGELINADSRHVYKYLDIVTGKDKDELIKSGIKVHLLDIVTPDKEFSSFDFVSFAMPIIEDVWSRKKVPILVGGTYLYIKHLLYEQDVKVPPNPKLRTKLENKSVEELQKILLHYYIKMKSEPKLNNSDWNNPRRLVRKIEIATASIRSLKSIRSVKSLQSNTSDKSSTLPFGLAQGEQALSFKIIGLKHKTKESLIDKITKRVEMRLNQGALEETKKILDLRYKITDPGLQTIGYKQIIAYLEGEFTLDEAKKDWVTNEVQYAKRQLTFMKLDKKIEWNEV